MNAYLEYLNKLININKEKLSPFKEINWLNPYESWKFQEARNALLDSIGSNILFGGTKPYYNWISKGCQICGQGLWSCLFITGKCNAGCFYCPAPQTRDEPPESQGMVFNTAEAYAGYVKYFNFKGVSFSGGEPLLFRERLFSYLQAVSQTAPSDQYIWMYTNGIEGTREDYKKLADLGLDEIRFDIGATGYRLDRVIKAKGIIKNITVEIPAIPEEKTRLKKMLPELISSGVTNLNLHQLRMTEYNAPRLFEKDYTFISAEKPIVLESELAALEILDHAKQAGLGIGINYCSFFFKNRYQSSGFRRTIARAYGIDDKSITEKGYVRSSDERGVSYQAVRFKDDTFNIENVFRLEYNSLYEKENVLSLLRSKPVNPPEEKYLFDVWNHEYLEEGLREY